MGFFSTDKHLHVKEIKRREEPMNRYIAPYQMETIIFTMLKEMCNKLDLNVEKILEPYYGTRRDHYKNRGYKFTEEDY